VQVIDSVNDVEDPAGCPTCGYASYLDNSQKLWRLETPDVSEAGWE
jgi:hypothetical protein